jgi:hypothetical protein
MRLTLILTVRVTLTLETAPAGPGVSRRLTLSAACSGRVVTGGVVASEIGGARVRLRTAPDFPRRAPGARTRAITLATTGWVVLARRMPQAGQGGTPRGAVA